MKTLTVPASTDQLDTVQAFIDELLSTVPCSPETQVQLQIAVEELFWNTNVTTGIRVAEARGVILLCAEQKGLAMQEYTPMQVKQAVVGYGKAEKKQVIAMVTMLLGLPKPPKPDDTADALAVAICHAHSAGSALAAYYNRP